jgi:drug/metabolite transporter (DMT)-like permease
MRNAALMLGIIGGIIGMIVGFFSYGFTEIADKFDLVDQVENVTRTRAASLLAPILAIAGGAMARARPKIGGGLLILSAGGMFWGFGFNAATMFPIAMVGVGGVLALAAKQPDEH